MTNHNYTPNAYDNSNNNDNSNAVFPTFSPHITYQVVYIISKKEAEAMNPQFVHNLANHQFNPSLAFQGLQINNNITNNYNKPVELNKHHYDPSLSFQGIPPATTSRSSFTLPNDTNTTTIGNKPVNDLKKHNYNPAQSFQGIQPNSRSGNIDPTKVQSRHGSYVSNT